VDSNCIAGSMRAEYGDYRRVKAVLPDGNQPQIPDANPNAVRRSRSRTGSRPSDSSRRSRRFSSSGKIIELSLHAIRVAVEFNIDATILTR